MTWKICPLLNFEILRVFVNTLTAEDKYPDGDCENLRFPIQMQLSEKQKNLSEFSHSFIDLHQILNIFKGKMIVAANEFPKSNTVKTWVDHSLASAVSEPPLIVKMLMTAKHF